jgi:CubicO group peptidase (beta-lactamase class C family)
MLLLSALALAAAMQAPAPLPGTDSLDAFIRTQMARRQVPGLSLAIIDDGKIVYAKGYGVTAPGGSSPVTTDTRFLAGSVSKSVAAMGALRLVEQGRLSLDGDVNDHLARWKVPENDHTRVEKVSIRRIVSHTAGLTVHGFPGYDRSAPLPTTEQILDGATPANTGPVRVDTVPGERWRYSGGGYTVMQLVMEDVTGQPFARWMQDNVLAPLGMASSSFDNPPTPAFGERAAQGQYADRRPVAGGWHVYPEMAAAGLWTTASDLARFAIGVQESHAGKNNPVISRSMTNRMLAYERNDFDGLGVFLQGNGPTLRFSHSGRDEGFDTYLGAFASRGQGVVVMINANDNSGLLRRIVNRIGRQYGWPAVEPTFPLKRVAMAPAVLATFAGRYEVANNQLLTIASREGQLVSLADGLPDRAFVATGPNQVTSDDRERQFTFVVTRGGQVSGFRRMVDGADLFAPRVGPMLADRRPRPDPDPAMTSYADSVLRALSKGGQAVAESRMPATSRETLGGEPSPVLAGFAGIDWLLDEDVTGRGIERHGSRIARVRHYRLRTPASEPFVLVHLTAEGAVADYDVVGE